MQNGKRTLFNFSKLINNGAMAIKQLYTYCINTIIQKEVLTFACMKMFCMWKRGWKKGG